MRATLLGIAGAVFFLGCSSQDGDGDTRHDGFPAPAPDSGDLGRDDAGPLDAATSPPCVDTLDSNRTCLLTTYFDFLKRSAIQPQSNGLSGSNVASVCEVWTKLDPSAQGVFLTLTARMQGSLLGEDGSSMLSHIKRIYRVTGGRGATAGDPGSCGGGEYNRMLMSMDAKLHAAQRAASNHRGAVQPNHKYDLGDVIPTSYWREPRDLGGPHTPFDASDETNGGAPRGQTQYFQDPTSTRASLPLGRLDLMTLVDPYALEFDQDYDCVHNSNPLCTYVTYGPLCAPKAQALGTDIYQGSYGGFAPSWKPGGCP